MYPIYPTVSPFTPQAQPQNIQYVNSITSVESCYLPPNSSAIYMDSNLPRFYTKHTDASGAATIRSFDFKETEQEKPAEYVTKSEFESFKAEMKGVQNESVKDVGEQ